MSPARFAALRGLMCISERDCARLAGLSPGGLRVQLKRSALDPPFAAWLERRAEAWRADPPPRRAGKHADGPPAVDMDALREAVGSKPAPASDRAARQRQIAAERAAKGGEWFPKSQALIAKAVAVAAYPIEAEAPKPARKRRKAGASA